MTVTIIWVYGIKGYVGYIGCMGYSGQQMCTGLELRVGDSQFCALLVQELFGCLNSPLLMRHIQG